MSQPATLEGTTTPDQARGITTSNVLSEHGATFPILAIPVEFPHHAQQRISMCGMPMFYHDHVPPCDRRVLQEPC